MRSTSKKVTHGFTLIELLVTVSLGMILITVAIPSFSSFIQNGRLTTSTNELASDINYARSEAVTRGVTIILCQSSNPTTNSPQCSGTNNNWTSGWLMFQSNDTNIKYDDGTDTLLRIHPPLEGEVTIMTNDTSKTELIYSPAGTLDMAGKTAVFAICDKRGVKHGNKLQISPTGRPRLITPVADSCDSPDV